jgi:hypothetical protein
MDENCYEMIFKRKSFHIFSGQMKIADRECDEIVTHFYTIDGLCKDIKTACKIVPREQTTCKRGEYCILLYSEKKGNYLQNIGYIGEQLDLWLASRNIGTCWYGMGKTIEQSYMGLEFAIMLAIEKADVSEFRKDMFKSKRKDLIEIWEGDKYRNVSNIARYAPSACNTQPWYVKEIENRVDIYRYKKEGKRGMMPISEVTYYNRIDIGIFILFIDICFEHEGIKAKKTVYDDFDCDNEKEMTLNASYEI